MVAEINGGEGALANSLAIRYPASDGESPALLHGSVLFVQRGIGPDVKIEEEEDADGDEVEN